jgi:uncharacterized protein (TIGR03067 family)
MLAVVFMVGSLIAAGCEQKTSKSPVKTNGEHQTATEPAPAKPTAANPLSDPAIVGTWSVDPQQSGSLGAVELLMTKMEGSKTPLEISIVISPKSIIHRYKKPVAATLEVLSQMGEAYPVVKDETGADCYAIEYTYALNTTTTPHEIDLHTADGLRSSKGIYKLEGDDLLLSVSGPGSETRPSDFVREQFGVSKFVIKARRAKHLEVSSMGTMPLDQDQTNQMMVLPFSTVADWFIAYNKNKKSAPTDMEMMAFMGRSFIGTVEVAGVEVETARTTLQANIPGTFASFFFHVKDTAIIQKVSTLPKGANVSLTAKLGFLNFTGKRFASFDDVSDLSILSIGQSNAVSQSATGANISDGQQAGGTK